MVHTFNLNAEAEANKSVSLRTTRATVILYLKQIKTKQLNK